MILVKDMTPVMETYYGKPKEFVYIEGELTKIISMVDDIYAGKKADINSSQELKNIETTFKKFFKVRDVSISFYSPGPMTPALNAFAMPSSFGCFHRDPDNKKLANPKSLFVNVNVDINMIKILKLTPGELMSIILHEMGHCFDASIFNLLSRVSIGIGISSKGDITIDPAIIENIRDIVMSMIPTGAVFTRLNKIFSSLISKIPVLQRLWNMFVTGLTSIQMFVSTLQTPFALAANYPIHLLIAAMSPYNIFGYGSEKFADSFATAYGYGPETASSEVKIAKNKHNIIYDAGKKIPVLNIGLDFLSTSGTVLGALLDPHPTSAARVVAQLNKLKRDIKDPNLDPKVKRMIQDDIDDIQRLIDSELLDAEKNAKQGEIFSTALNAFIIKGFNGKIDPRELIQFAHEEL